MSMTPERWEFISNYAVEVFGSTDPTFEGLMDRAERAGIPRIAISADVGRLLKILVSLVGARTALELGTLGGYSAIWIARGMPPGSRLLTIEAEPRHADFAESEIARAALEEIVEVIRGSALAVLEDLAPRLGRGSVDFVFIDAVKREYVDYFRAVKDLIRPGGLLVADNVYGTGRGWIDEGYGTDDFNRLVAGDPEFETVALPIREGILIARRHD